MARVVVVVMNSVSFDARVRRQSASLRRVGHDIHIIGVKDALASAARETWPDGVTVERTGLAPLPRRQKETRPGGPAAAAAKRPALPPGEPSLRPLVGKELGHVSRLWFALRHSGAPLAMLWFQLRRRMRDMAVARRVRAAAPDLIHVHDVGALPIGAFARRLTGVPLVFDAHEIYDQAATTKASKEAKRRRETHTIARFAKDVSGLVTINDSFVDYYRTHYPDLPPATVVGNANSPPPGGPYDGRLHDAAGLERGRRIALYQGKFHDNRNLPELVDAAAFLDPRWAIVFMGWGGVRAELEARRAALPEAAQERVRFVDRVPHGELLTWTSGAAVGVIPYDNHSLNHWFSTPNKLWEFPQADVPIVASPFPEMRRRVELFGHGWLLDDPFDPEATARLLNGLDDPALASARAACARFNAADNWTIYEERLLALYARLLGQPQDATGAGAGDRAA